MLSQNLLQFLYDLRDNNNRDWFHDNNARYQIAKKEFEQFIALVIMEISQFDPSIKNVNPKDCIFRINRDIRFSNNKSPYKTNIGGFIVPGGRNAGYAGYYIHIEPENCFLAGGIYMPPADRLKAVRTEIYENTDQFKEIIYKKEFVKQFGELMTEDKLKQPPKGFPKDFPEIDLLKYKHYSVSKAISEKMIVSKTYLKETIETFRIMYPFIQFINEAINYQLNKDN
ncbi:MAG: hypothetical protein A2W99_12085 [Bacteroidetes bacterium GWF2_33_16]|nr:MAG: hypothetical protein A2X00_02190 [Bacteroidetes bacterium GWE2_32_14]OFY06437.1 MAG: hypothetical protein A2W99_12085 [Bacteroidetes bacterium GWF2_33_16]